MLQHASQPSPAPEGIAHNSMVAWTVGRLTWKRPMSYCTPVLSPSCLRDAMRGDAYGQNARWASSNTTQHAHAPLQLRLRQRAHIPPQRGLHPVRWGRQAVLAACVVGAHVPGGTQPPRQAGLVDTQVVGDRALHRQHAQWQRNAGGRGLGASGRGARGRTPSLRAHRQCAAPRLPPEQRAHLWKRTSPRSGAATMRRTNWGGGRRVSGWPRQCLTTSARAFHSGKSWVPRLATSS